MDQPADMPMTGDRLSRRDNATAILLLAGIVFAFSLRFYISPYIMNAVVNYTGESGAFYEKLHFGTYAIFGMLVITLFSRPFQLAGDDIGKFRALLRYGGLLIVLIGYLMVSGRAGSSGFIIDTYLVAAAAGLIMLAIPPAMRRAVGKAMIVMLTLSAVEATFEAATHTRIFPYGGMVELSFRPLGFAEHPLTLGALCATAIAFATLVRWPIWARVGTILLLLVGNAASGARFSLLLAAAEIVALLVILPWPGLSASAQRRAKLGVLTVTVVVGGGAFLALAGGGFLARFSGTLFDENFLARITIYRIFEFVSPGEILLGKNLNDVVAIVNEKLKLPYIESTPVYLTFLFGLPLALLFAAMLFRLIWRMLRHAPLAAWIGTGTFLLAVLSNNTLSSKTPVVALIVVLILAFNIPKGHPGDIRPER